MSEQSSIQWTGATWNPFQGCRKISLGCKNCYMFRDKERYGQDPTRVHRSAKATFDAPLKWQREAEKGNRVGAARLVFTCSWSDWFIEEADAWRDDAWSIVEACPLLTFQVLTKRADRIKDHLPAGWGGGWPNVWMMVSVENQDAIWRAIELLKIPAAIRGLSIEPLLGPIDLNRDELLCETWRKGITIGTYLDWCIVGGESGNRTGSYRARECRTTWIRSIVEQCRASDTPCFVKQLGSNVLDPVRGPEFGLPLDVVAKGYDWKLSLRDTHGGDMGEWPEDLRIRNFPRPEVANAR